MADLEKLAEKVAAELEPIVRELKDLPKEEQEARLELLRPELHKRLQAIQAQVDAILLPHQQQRLRQVALQLQMKKAGPAQAIASQELQRALGISDEQAARLRESLPRIEEEFRQKLADLEQEKQRQILAQFTPDQQEKLKALIGPLMRDQPKAPPGNPKGPPPAP